MEEICPLCYKKFPIRFLERHVNSCLDIVLEKSLEPEKDNAHNALAALGLKADSSRASERSKKAGATLTSILLAERRLRRKQEDLEKQIRDNADFNAEPKSDAELVAGTSIPYPELVTSSIKDVMKELDVETAKRTPSETVDIAAELTPFNSQDSHTAEALSVKVQEPSKMTAGEEYTKLKRESEVPLAHRLRPTCLDDFFGQEKLAGENGVLRNFVAAQNVPSFILWGVPGIGKTSLARIVAVSSGFRFVELSGSDSNAKKLKETFFTAQNERRRTGLKTVLFLDEIHRFNRAVQDLLLPAIEKGVVTVIGATTENPTFSLNNALLSRVHTFVMEPLLHETLVRIISKGLLILNKTRKIVHGVHVMALSKDALDYIAELSSGDSRAALNILESVHAYLSGTQYQNNEFNPDEDKIAFSSAGAVIKVSSAQLKLLLKSRNFQHVYDRKGDNHYEAISAFHKAVRGSDADAAIFYLVKMLHGGEDPLFIMRRMMVIASEDIGLRDLLCLPFVNAALSAVQFVGMPEAEIVMAHCAIKLARAPKSTKLFRALRNAKALFRDDPQISLLPIPYHLRNAPTTLMKEMGYGESYKYNPQFKHGLVKQAFLPPEVKDLKLVEETHLGDLIDLEVADDVYEAQENEHQCYKRFKALRKRQIIQQMSENRRKKYMEPFSVVEMISSDDAERLSSYDENLSKDAQPEYFDGTETDKYSQNE